jgi:transposase-like protein
MPYDLDTKAKALVDAQLTTDREAADKHGCSRKSIERWRDGLDADPDLQARVSDLWRQIREADDWMEDAAETMREAHRFLRKATEKLDPSDPDALEALATAYEALADAKMMGEIVEARLGERDVTNDPVPAHKRRN